MASKVKILDYLWGAFLVALIAYMSVFAVLQQLKAQDYPDLGAWPVD